ncbi:M48 family metallopeptidase [Pelatocladus sp. BLCC-F211]|uniref:M48 family metallopeptidase n=1 Tax=Pelatocladus sp. BLCC-F211 TaxID=3342752 RepID=UPI0035B9DC6D
MNRQKNIKIKLGFASILTVFLLINILAIPLIGAMYLLNALSFSVLNVIIIFSSIFNCFIFCIAPFLMDLKLKSLYGRLNWTTSHKIGDSYVLTSACIQKICRKYKIPEPKLLVANDKVPFAFTYGNFPYNARIVISSELLRCLNDEELASVYAHELGHIVRWDFAVMTLAQVLTSAIRCFSASFSSNSSDYSYITVFKFIYQLSLALFSQISIFSYLYLSRIRELSADYFAAENIDNPNTLAKALIKISYSNIIQNEANIFISNLRSLNIYDSGRNKDICSEDEQDITQFLQGLINPSTHWTDFLSTHPLPGIRIKAIADYSQLNLSDIASELKDYKDYKRTRSSHSYSPLNRDTNIDEEADNSPNSLSSIKIILRRSKCSLIFIIFMIFGSYGQYIFMIYLIISLQVWTDLYFMLFVVFYTFLIVNISPFIVDNLLPFFNSDYLILNPLGLEIKLARKKIFLKWAEIKDIGVVVERNSFLTTKYVGFNFSNVYTDKLRIKSSKFRKLITGYDFCLTPFYKNDPYELTRIVRKWKYFHS